MKNALTTSISALAIMLAMPMANAMDRTPKEFFECLFISSYECDRRYSAAEPDENQLDETEKTEFALGGGQTTESAEGKELAFVSPKDHYCVGDSDRLNDLLNSPLNEELAALYPVEEEVGREVAIYWLFIPINRGWKKWACWFAKKHCHD